MAVGLKEYSILFPQWYDERAALEHQWKGFLPEVEVQFAEGARYQLFFYDPTRLAQELATLVKCGTPCVSEPNMVVIPEITRPAIDAAVAALLAGNQFSHFKALN